MSFWTCLGLLLVGAVSMSRAEIQAQASISTQEAGVGEPITLTVQVQTDENPETLPWPDIKGLEPFSVKKTTGNSQSSSTTIVNGQVSHQNYYLVNFTYTLVSQKPGTFTVGPIRYAHKGYDRNLGQAAIKVEKQKANLTITPMVSKSKVYVGEQIVYTLRIIPQPGVQSINLTQDLQKLIGSRFYFQRLENKVEPKTLTLNGEPTKVFDLHISLFPLLTGTAKLEGIPVQYQQITRSQRKRSGSVFDMFDDEFFGGARMVSLEAISSPLTVEAMALPSPAPAGFSGSVGEYSLTASLDRGELPSGEAVSLTVTIRGNGQPKSIGQPQMPDLTAFEVFNPEEETGTQIRDGQLWSWKTYKYVMVPKRKGEYQLGSITYPYFQPSRQAYLSAKSDALTLTVTQGKENEVASGRVMSQQEIAEIGSDIRHIQTGVPLAREDAFLYRLLGFWALWTLSPLSFAGAMVMRSRRRKLSSDASLKRRSEAGSHLRRRLKEADAALGKKEAKVFYRELSSALQGFASDKLDFEFRGITLDEALAKLGNAGLSKEGLKGWETLWQECDFGQFAGLGGDVEAMRKAREAGEQLLRRLDKELRP